MLIDLTSLNIDEQDRDASNGDLGKPRSVPGDGVTGMSNEVSLPRAKCDVKVGVID